MTTGFEPLERKLNEERVRSTRPEIVESETRQKIIDSWSEDVDDSKAVEDWSWKAKYDFQKAFEEYLIPSIKSKYQ